MLCRFCLEADWALCTSWFTVRKGGSTVPIGRVLPGQTGPIPSQLCPKGNLATAETA